MGTVTENVIPGDMGDTLHELSTTIHERRLADPLESYTACLLSEPDDTLLSKIGEEAIEVIMAAKDGHREHIRYEVGDLIYHLLVALERYEISLDELAGELNARMK
jgi:phosphoribosyl-ATP pyrophosphohydrolase